MKRLIFVVPVLVFVGLMLAFVLGLRRDPSKIPSALIDQPLPAFDLAAVRGAGPGLKTADFRGGPAVLNVFASWCVACRIEHPVLLDLKAEGVVIYGLDWKDEPAAAARYLAEVGDPYLRVGNDPSGRTGIDLGVTGVPETFIVDRLGRVRYKHVGPIRPEDWEQTLGPMLVKLRAEP